MGDSLEIRPLDLDGVREAVEWADREGWEPGLTDAEPFFAADPDAFFEAVVDDTRVATISLVRNSPEVAFVGFYIVDPEYRGNGYGKRLWDEVLGRFEGSTIGGDAVPAQIPNYESDGFHVAYANARYSGASIGRTVRGHPVVGSTGAGPTDIAEVDLVEASDFDFEQLAAFDAAHCFGPRPEFLKLWIEGPGREALVATDGSGQIVGFAASRPSGAGHRIGPVFAGEASVAKALIVELAGRAGGRVSVDVPMPNRAAVDLVRSLGMTQGFETARIYKGPDPLLPLDRIFGITSFELG